MYKIFNTVLLILCLLLTLAMNDKSATNLPSKSHNKGFSFKEMGEFLDQVESQFMQDELIIEIAVIGNLMEVTSVNNAAEHKQRLYFEKFNKEWKRKGIDSSHADPMQFQEEGISIKDVSAFFIQAEGQISKDEGIVGAKFTDKIIQLKTASVYIPLAGRGHIITFEKVKGRWRKVAESEWMS